MQRLAYLLIALGGLALLGALQNADPDCILNEADGGTYLRMCDGVYHELSAYPWWLFAASFTLIASGVYLVYKSKARDNKDKSSDGHEPK